MDSNFPVIAVEVVMVFGGALLFGWWQLRDIKKAQNEAAERAANRVAEQAAQQAAEQKLLVPKPADSTDSLPLSPSKTTPAE